MHAYTQVVEQDLCRDKVLLACFHICVYILRLSILFLCKVDRMIRNHRIGSSQQYLNFMLLQVTLSIFAFILPHREA